jgi:hypothetical protein
MSMYVSPWDLIFSINFRGIFNLFFATVLSPLAIHVRRFARKPNILPFLRRIPNERYRSMSHQ